MKIIKSGILPQEKEYECICKNCRCVFKFQKKEAEEYFDQRDGDYLVVKCPQIGCGTDNTVYS